MRNISLFLFSCFLTLIVSLPATASEQEGEFRIGVVGEYSNANTSGDGGIIYGSFGGLLAGYNANVNDRVWYDLSGKYIYGEYLATSKNGCYSTGKLRAIGKLGTTYDYGVKLKPFIGLGINYEMWDLRGANNAYTTDYILPIGLMAEKETAYGQFGVDVQYEYVLQKEIYTTEAGSTGATSSFGGSSNVELGISYEPKNLPIGIRPYYRYEHWTKKEDGWDATTINTCGLEIFYHF